MWLGQGEGTGSTATYERVSRKHHQWICEYRPTGSEELSGYLSKSVPGGEHSRCKGSNWCARGSARSPVRLKQKEHGGERWEGRSEGAPGLESIEHRGHYQDYRPFYEMKSHRKPFKRHGLTPALQDHCDRCVGKAEDGWGQDGQLGSCFQDVHGRGWWLGSGRKWWRWRRVLVLDMF